jgi:hypothetical protein
MLHAKRLSRLLLCRGASGHYHRPRLGQHHPIDVRSVHQHHRVEHVSLPVHYYRLLLSSALSGLWYSQL